MAEEAMNMSLDDLIAKSSKKTERKAGTRDGKAGRTRIAVGGGKSRVRVGKVQPTKTLPPVKSVITKRTGTRQVSVKIPRSAQLVLPTEARTDRRNTRDAPPRPRIIAEEAIQRVAAELVGNRKWGHNGFIEQNGRDAATARKPQGHKLLVSNLDYNVSEDDVQELFATVEPLREHRILYDNSGRSTGRAEVVFAMAKHAQEAIERYHEVQLDGKPMHITHAAPAGKLLSSGRTVGDGRVRNGGAPKLLHMDVERAPRRVAAAGRRGPATRSRPQRSQTDLDKDLADYMEH